MERSLVETLASAMSMVPVQCLGRKARNFGGVDGGRGGNLPSVLPVPFVRMPMLVGEHVDGLSDHSSRIDNREVTDLVPMCQHVGSSDVGELHCIAAQIRSDGRTSRSASRTAGSRWYGTAL